MKTRPPGRYVGLVICALMLLLTACDEEPDERTVQVEGGDAARGSEALVTYGCGACHTIPGVEGANTTIGPPLNDWADRWYIAGLLINEPEELILWIQAPQSVQPGVAMPDMGVSTGDARDMAAYLYTLRRDR